MITPEQEKEKEALRAVGVDPNKVHEKKIRDLVLNTPADKYDEKIVQGYVLIGNKRKTEKERRFLSAHGVSCAETLPLGEIGRNGVPRWAYEYLAANLSVNDMIALTMKERDIIAGIYTYSEPHYYPDHPTSDDWDWRSNT